MLLDIVAFIVAAAALARASLLLVDTLTKIALKLKISEFLVGFVLIAIGSSLPELVVGIVAATEGEPLLSLGNIIGSNIVNLTLILGIPALVAGGIRIRSQVRNREVIFMNLLAIAPLLLVIDGEIGRGEGILLVLLFLLYLYNLILRSSSYTRVVKNHRRKISLPVQILLFIAGLAILLGSAHVLIQTGTSLAATLKIPTILIGIFVLALGTSLPELSFDITAALRRDGEILMGETLGSIISNATLIIGITAIINPIVIENRKIIATSSAMLVVSLLVFTFFVRSQYKVTVKEGVILIFGYLVFVVLELLFGVRM
jgi:cation:H+ antiporter